VWENVIGSAIGTVVGLVAFILFWAFCDYWTDARATDKEE